MIYGAYIINKNLLYIKPDVIKVFYKKVLSNHYKAFYRHFTHTRTHTTHTFLIKP